jgi:hypothetical protein
MTSSSDPTIPLKRVKPDSNVLPGIHSLRSEIEDLSKHFRRNVTLTFDHRTGSWLASIGDRVVSSLVGPSNALTQLERKLNEEGIDDTETDEFEKIDPNLETQFDPNRGKPGLGFALVALLILAAAGWFAVTLVRMAWSQ